MGKTKLLWTTVLKWLLVAGILIVIIAVLQARTFEYKNINQYATSDVVYADGRTAHFDDKYFGTVNKGDVVTLHVRLPEQPLFVNSTLVFYDFNTVTEVWCGDTLLNSYGEELAAKGLMLGNHDFLIAIPDMAWGDEITIVLRVTENRAFSDFTNIKVYPSETVYRFYTDSDPIGFVIALSLLVFGLIGLFVLGFSKMRGTAFRNALALSFTALLISLWMITNKGLYNLFGFTAYFWQPLEYIAGYALPIPTLLFFRGMAEKRPKWTKWFDAFIGIAIAFFVVSIVLNFTNILHFDALMEVAGGLMLLSGLLMLGYTTSVKSGKSSTGTMLRTGVYFFVANCLYEVLIRNLYIVLPLSFIHNLPSLISIGVVALIVCMTGAFCTDLYDKQKDLVTVQVKANTFSEVIDATPVGICQLVPDEQYTIVSANNLYYKIMGYQDSTPETEKPQTAFAFLCDDEKAFLRKKVDEVLQGTENQGEFEFSTTDSAKKPLTFLIRYFYDREGSGNITVSLIDISERKRMEEELRLSEERYKLALSQSGKLFFSLDVPTKTMFLSQALADAFGLPLEVDHMPENFISQGLVEPESAENYRHLYDRIYAGDRQGETIISCHMKNTPEQVLWYKMTFTSILDENENPTYAIITCNDITEQYEAELSSKWKQFNIAALPEKKYVVATYDLTRNQLLDQTGGLFADRPEMVCAFDEGSVHAAEAWICPDDLEAWKTFFDRNRLLELFRSGKSNDRIEYRALQRGESFRWTSAAASLIEAPYNQHVMLQLVFVDIHDEKSGEIQMQNSMEELQKELDNSRIRIMINQMQPHFLYNALSAIQTIIKFDPDYAYQLIYDFTVHLRSSIKALSSDAPIPFSNEIDNVRAYLNIEKMRFGDKINIVYELESVDFSVIPLSIQPLAENAARHGLYPKGDEGGTIWIRSRETDDTNIVEVEDDGEGFNVQEVLNRCSDSIGLKNLIYRLKTLMNAEVVIKSKIGEGTLVRVVIPKEQGERSDNDSCGQ